MFMTAPISRPPADLHEELGGVDKVVEGVLLLEQLAVQVPGAAHFAAAADVRHAYHHAARQQHHALGLELGIKAQAVRAVAVEQHGRVAARRHALVKDQRNGHGRAVSRRGVEQLRAIVFGFVRRHLELLDDGEARRLQIAVESRLRRHH
jgi:hypothetical protein